jgi:HEAT repeat protein
MRRSPMIPVRKMKVIGSLWTALLALSVIAVSAVSADTVETFIKQLKDPSPEVRVKAAEELCVS